MRLLALMLIVFASPAMALDRDQIESACYTDCEQETESNPDYKACLARAADTADALLNHEFRALREKIEATAKSMGVRPDAQLEMLREAQRTWIAYRDKACAFEDSLAFGASATGGIYSSCVCALSYERINDFARTRHSVLGE